MTVLQIIFLLVAAATLIASIMVVATPKLVHAALWLVVALAGVAVVFVLLEANFLAAVQVVVYIGAIAILIIFGVMLTRRVMFDSGPQVNRNWWAGALVCLVLMVGLTLMFLQVPIFGTPAEPLAFSADQSIIELGTALVDVDGFVLPFEVASVLLLAAMIGAIVIARPVEKEEGGVQ